MESSERESTIIHHVSIAQNVIHGFWRGGNRRTFNRCDLEGAALEATIEAVDSYAGGRYPLAAHVTRRVRDALIKLARVAAAERSAEYELREYAWDRKYVRVDRNGLTYSHIERKTRSHLRPAFFEVVRSCMAGASAPPGQATDGADGNEFGEYGEYVLSLPTPEREALTRYLHGEEVVDISYDLGVRQEAVYARIARAKEMLRRKVRHLTGGLDE